MTEVMAMLSIRILLIPDSQSWASYDRKHVYKLNRNLDSIRGIDVVAHLGDVVYEDDGGLSYKIFLAGYGRAIDATVDRGGLFIGVPGNHDYPLTHYDKYIQPLITPTNAVVDGHCAMHLYNSNVAFLSYPYFDEECTYDIHEHVPHNISTIIVIKHDSTSCGSSQQDDVVDAILASRENRSTTIVVFGGHHIKPCMHNIYQEKRGLANITWALTNFQTYSNTTGYGFSVIDIYGGCVMKIKTYDPIAGRRITIDPEYTNVDVQLGGGISGNNCSDEIVDLYGEDVVRYVIVFLVLMCLSSAIIYMFFVEGTQSESRYKKIK